MNLGDALVYGLVGMFILVAMAYGWHAYLSPEARERRRRQRSHRPVASRVHRPMVKFSVRSK